MCQIGNPVDDNQLIVHRQINMNNNLIKFLYDLNDPQDAATKSYDDGRTDRVFVIARAGTTTPGHSNRGR